MKETVSDGAHEVRWGVDSRGKVQRIMKRAISDFRRGPGWWTNEQVTIDEERVL